MPRFSVVISDDDTIVLCRPLVDSLLLLGADVANLEVITTQQLSLRVKDRVNVQTGGSGTSSQFTKPKDKLLLEFGGEIVLSTEEYHATLGD